MRSGQVNWVNKNKAEEGIRKDGGRGVVSDRLPDGGEGKGRGGSEQSECLVTF